MKNLKIYTLSGLLLLLMGSFQPYKETYTLTVNIIDVSNDKGKVWVALYNSAETYMKKEYQGKSAKIQGKKSQLVFSHIPAGTYAASSFHDENGNDKLDTNGLGIPKEDYGFSNNPNAMFGPPSFSKARFSVSENTTLTISLD